MHEQLTLARHGDGADIVIVARGEIDVATSPLLRAELSSVIAASPSMVTVDLAGVSFVDSSGLGVLVGALMQLRSIDPTAVLRVVGLQEPVRKVFDVTGLDELFAMQE